MKCPGQDTRFWKPGDIFEVACSQCGHQIEFFKDDPIRRCSRCGQRIQNPKLSLGCAQWCEHAQECLGFDPKTVPAEDPDEVSLVDRLIAAMKKEFGDDQKCITHALSVLERAQELLREEGGDPRVVLTAAVLHDIGIQEAEKKHGSPAGKYQEIEGPPIAQRIMEELNLDKDTIEHVSRIIGNHHSVKDIDTPEFRIVWDADWLVNIPDEFPDADSNELSSKIEKIFKTGSGKKKAYEMYGGDRT
ncbi:MAG: HD domain-containing protein [Deltaproteobacteria bacterium]|nr:MAG: HD domain-containing protein [Deltaproteobacteria bacterium]